MRRRILNEGRFSQTLGLKKIKFKLFSFQYFISNLNPGHGNGCGKFLFFFGRFESFWGFNIEGLDQEAVLDQEELWIQKKLWIKWGH